MIGYNPIYEYAALPDTPRLVAAVRRAMATSREREDSNPAIDAMPAVDLNAAASSPMMASSSTAHAPANAMVPGSNEIEVKVPIMGEGIRSARIVTLRKQPGEKVNLDDVLCEVETDKAVYPIEAAFAGTFKAWHAAVDDTVEIGQVIAVVEGDEASVAALAATAAVSSVVPAAHPSLQQLQRTKAASVTAVVAPPGGTPREPALPASITRRLATVVPASMQLDVAWKAIRDARSAAKQASRDYSPSLMLAWAVCRAMERHAGFRCIITREGEILQQDNFDLGFAVALEGDRLATAVIRECNRLGFADFATAYVKALADTRAGKITEVQSPINLTSLGAFGIESAVPIVVPPAVGTLFIGRAHERMINEGGQIYPQEVATLSLTFDHRVVNGAGAAAFMHEIKAQIEGFKLPG